MGATPRGAGFGALGTLSSSKSCTPMLGFADLYQYKGSLLAPVLGTVSIDISDGIGIAAILTCSVVPSAQAHACVGKVDGPPSSLGAPLEFLAGFASLRVAPGGCRGSPTPPRPGASARLQAWLR